METLTTVSAQAAARLRRQSRQCSTRPRASWPRASRRARCSQGEAAPSTSIELNRVGGKIGGQTRHALQGYRHEGPTAESRSAARTKRRRMRDLTSLSSDQGDVPTRFEGSGQGGGGHALDRGWLKPRRPSRAAIGRTRKEDYRVRRPFHHAGARSNTSATPSTTLTRAGLHSSVTPFRRVHALRRRQHHAGLELIARHRPFLFSCFPPRSLHEIARRSRAKSTAINNPSIHSHVRFRFQVNSDLNNQRPGAFLTTTTTYLQR